MVELVGAALLGPAVSWAEVRDGDNGRGGYAVLSMDDRVARLEKRLADQPMIEMSRGNDDELGASEPTSMLLILGFAPDPKAPI